MSENYDQIALVRWIAAGLAIPEVRSLHGDAAYLLGNMISKYSLAASSYLISTKALQEFEALGADLNTTYTRSKFYGKKSPFIYEHPTPSSITRTQLLQIVPDETTVSRILLESGHVTVLLRSEDECLTKAGLRNSMPSEWVWGESPYARYEQVGIEISMKKLLLKGKIRR